MTQAIPEDHVEARAPAAASSTPPFSRYERMVAWRYMRSRRRRWAPSAIAGFSILGIAVGVMALIVVMSVMNGFHKELRDKILGVNGHMFLQGSETPLTDYEDVVRILDKVEGVTLAIPMVEGAAGVSTPVSQAGALVRGVREVDLKKLPGISANVKLGTLDGFDEAGGVAIGMRMAENLGLRVGDNITVLTAKGAQTPFGVAPRIKAYPVVAIFKIGMSEFDGLFVYMPLPEAQAFFNKDGEVSVIEAFVDNPEKMDAMRAKLESIIPRPLLMVDWTQRNQTFFEALKVERTAMFTILTLIVFVAALNIISGLIMLVKDKGRDVAILRTMGATSGAVMRIFLMVGVSNGVVGALFGSALGLLIAWNVEAIRQFVNDVFSANIFPSELYFLSRLPSLVEPRDVIGVVGMTVLLSILATIYPSWRAARLDPVDALRYE